MDPITFVFQIAILIMSVVIHEVSHGLVAYALGDSTAKYAGRLTLNPIKHLDPVGSILVPAILSLLPGSPIFGWARPVPYNPYNLKNQRWGPGAVAAAGPLSNLLVAIVFAFFLRSVSMIPPGMMSAQFLSAFVSISIAIVFINILLAVFNLIPIPPLDGSRVLSVILPYRAGRALEAFEQYGFFFLILMLIAFGDLIVPVVTFIFRLLVGVPAGVF